MLLTQGIATLSLQMQTGVALHAILATVLAAALAAHDTLVFSTFEME